MDDTLQGTRNKRGDHVPNEPAEHAPLFAFPPKPAALLKWLPHDFWPCNLPFGLSALASWYWVLPDVEAMASPS